MRSTTVHSQPTLPVPKSPAYDPSNLPVSLWQGQIAERGFINVPPKQDPSGQPTNTKTAILLDDKRLLRHHLAHNRKPPRCSVVPTAPSASSPTRSASASYPYHQATNPGCAQYSTSPYRSLYRPRRERDTHFLGWMLAAAVALMGHNDGGAPHGQSDQAW